MTTTFVEPVAKEWLTGVLKERPVVIKFTKVDGSERTMKCTLNESLILPLPEPVQEKEKKARKENENVIRVYDLEKESWRSFRLDSIISVNFDLVT